MFQHLILVEQDGPTKWVGVPDFDSYLYWLQIWHVFYSHWMVLTGDCPKTCSLIYYDVELLFWNENVGSRMTSWKKKNVRWDWLVVFLCTLIGYAFILTTKVVPAFLFSVSSLVVLKDAGGRMSAVNVSSTHGEKPRRPPVKVLSSQLREAKGCAVGSGKTELSIRRLGSDGWLTVSVVWMQGTVVEAHTDQNSVMLLDETGNFHITGVNNIPRGKPCLIPG